MIDMIIGVDPGFTTGIYATTANVEKGLGESALIQVRKTKEIQQGIALLAQLSGQIEERIVAFSRNDTRRTAVFLEGHAYSRMSTGGSSVVELSAILRSRLYARDITTCIVSPSAVKKFASNKGNASKEQVADAVRKRWTFDPNPFTYPGGAHHDLVDAFVLAQFGCCVYFPVSYISTAWQLECVKRWKKKHW